MGGTGASLFPSLFSFLFSTIILVLILTVFIIFFDPPRSCLFTTPRRSSTGTNTTLPNHDMKQAGYSFSQSSWLQGYFLRWFSLYAFRLILLSFFFFFL